ncbi:2Fe-2S iron-sulfur cluster-binding protein [Hyphococcus sp.]|uniref:2Fe-2S iron-sulfur cluster-binding protein n=1 Tax=Hyphococcus sp. TaxID=2038636 RepID=UPI0035C69156
MISNHATDVERCETFQIIVENSAPISCSVGANVLEALERAGHKGIPVGCRRGGCGICRVKIIAGDVLRKRMSREKVSFAEEKQNYALACCIYPRSDLTVKPAPRPLDDQ